MSTAQHPITREMYLVHDTFRREFGLLPAVIRSVEDGDAKQAGVVADHYAVIRAVLYAHHHGEDERAWPMLIARGPQEATAVARAMETQHEELDKIVTEVTAGLASWRETANQEQGVVIADAAARLSRTLNEHLAEEEEQALPLMEKYITEAEWNQGVEKGVGYVTPDQAMLFLGMMMYEGEADAVREVIAHMPPDAQPVIGDLATTAFAQHSELVYGTSTPPRIGAVR
jgi:hemerythrin-like domain-containing protein